MNTKLILGFLDTVARNNNRPWFLEHKKEYNICKADFEADITRALSLIHI